MAAPILSVLLPNFNNAPFLRECLDSLYNQTFQDFVIFFVDDCSTDNSVEIAASYPQEKMVIIRKDKNSGIVDTLNAGLDQITSKYFIRMDGDDFCDLNRFEKLFEFMENHPDIGVCTSDILTFGIENELVQYEVDSLQNKANLIFCHSIGHPSSIFRTSVLKDNNIQYQNDFWRLEDYQLFYRLKNLTLFSCVPEVLYHYRRGDYNLNSEIKFKMSKEFIRFYKNIFIELNLDFNEEDVAVHCEMAAVLLPTHRLWQYRSHIDRLIAANNRTKVFPDKQLGLRLDKAFRKLCFWLVDSKQITFIEVVRFGFKYKHLLKYYLIKRIKKQK